VSRSRGRGAGPTRRDVLAASLAALAPLAACTRDDTPRYEGGWVGADAAFLADQITSRDATQQPAEGPPAAARDAVTGTPDGKRFYVANAGSNSVSVIDVATRKELTQIPVGQVPKRNITAVLP